MQDYLVGLEKLMGEHEQVLSKIRGFHKSIGDLDRLRQNWIPGRPMDLKQEFTQLEEALDSIVTYLEEHLRIEEQELLPVFTKYATDIVNRGVCYEHREILKSLSNLRQHSTDLIGKPANREELLNKQLEVTTLINGILQTMQEHTNTQKVIFNLAREALAQESEHER
ncbi:hemerythrin domain-containing protein [Chloroflexota bacterium]